MQKIFYLIDGSCYIFRYFFGIPQIYHNGMPVNILHGYCNMLKKIINNKDYNLKKALSNVVNLDNCQQFITIAFDSAKEKSFRKEIYTEYKSNRVTAPDELTIQCYHLQEIINAFQINSDSITSFEADDIIATYTEIALKNDFDYVVIFSCDKDLMQLVSDKVYIYESFKGIIYDTNKVYEKFQVMPKQIVDYLALVGDSADNIPGVPGIGPKTAAKMLGLYNDMHGIFSNIDELMPARHRKSLLDNQDIVYMSRKLAKLNKEISIEKSIHNLLIKKAKITDLSKIYENYGIKN